MIHGPWIGLITSLLLPGKSDLGIKFVETDNLLCNSNERQANQDFCRKSDLKSSKCIKKLSLLAEIWIVVEVPIIKLWASWKSFGQNTSQIDRFETWFTAYVKYQQTFMVLKRLSGYHSLVSACSNLAPQWSLTDNYFYFEWIRWSHRCWWRMLETRSFGDN